MHSFLINMRTFSMKKKMLLVLDHAFEGKVSINLMESMCWLLSELEDMLVYLLA